MGVNTYISIGNSDDRLTQPRWADLIGDMRDLLNVGWRDRLQIHGEWFSAPDQPWQNANWCVEILPPAWWARASEPDGPEGAWVRAQAVIARDAEMDENRNRLKERVRDLCLHYSQDTFAWTTGTVELVETGRVPDRNRQELTPGAVKDSTPPAPASTGDSDWARTETEPQGSAGITMKPSKARAIRQASRHEEWHTRTTFEECENADCKTWRGVL